MSVVSLERSLFHSVFGGGKKVKKNQLEPGQESIWDAPVVTLSFAKKSLTKTDLCAGTPRDGESQLLGSSFFGEFPSNRIPKCDE